MLLKLLWNFFSLQLDRTSRQITVFLTLVHEQVV